MKPSLKQAVDQILERRKLKVLDILCAESLARAHDATQRRRSLHAQIKACAQGGAQVPNWYLQIEPRQDTPFHEAKAYVALVRSGRDCDGVQYGNDVTYVPADWRMVLARIDADERHADGPIYHQIMKPSEARKLHPHSRDLTLEAFEDGHAWCLHP